MDDATSRTRTSGRRMASAKPASTTRRSGSGRGSKKDQGPEISRTRWAGVAFVITAIVVAIALAVVSPSEPRSDLPGTALSDATPSPAPSPSGTPDTRIPTSQPVITSPSDGPTPEVEITVTVAIPEEEELAAKHLTLLIMRGDDVLVEQPKPKPKPGTSVDVAGVRLEEGVANELVAVLRGPGGATGPRSKPVVLTQDPDLPQLEILSPQKGETTFDKYVTVVGTSEVGVEVSITNAQSGFGPRPKVVGPNGEFSVRVPLAYGVNRIVAAGKDQIGQPAKDTVRVTRKDGRPTIKEVKHPKSIAKAELPKAIRVVVSIVDHKGDPMSGAEVAVAIGAPGYDSVGFEDDTGTNGKVIGQLDIPWSNSRTRELALVVSVTSPQGDSKEEVYPIALS